MLCGRLANAQVLLSTSRFESTPVQGLEALCQGCTLVASDGVPGYKSLIADGAFGETLGNSAEDCVRALQTRSTGEEKGNAIRGRLRRNGGVAVPWKPSAHAFSR